MSEASVEGRGDEDRGMTDVDDEEIEEIGRRYMQQELALLIDGIGMTPTQAVDWWMVNKGGVEPVEWAEARDRHKSNVYRTLDGAEDALDEADVDDSELEELLGETDR